MRRTRSQLTRLKPLFFDVSFATPLRLSCGSNLVASFVHFFLWILFLAVLVMKTCEPQFAEVACAAYGLGNQLEVTNFFFVFAVSLLFVMLILGAANLWYTGHVSSDTPRRGAALYRVAYACAWAAAVGTPSMGG